MISDAAMNTAQINKIKHIKAILSGNSRDFTISSEFMVAYYEERDPELRSGGLHTPTALNLAISAPQPVFDGLCLSLSLLRSLSLCRSLSVNAFVLMVNVEDDDAM